MVSLNQSSIDSIWLLVHSSQPIDAEMLYHHLASTHKLPADYRSRILIRDSIAALASRWGKDKLRTRLAADDASELLTLADFEQQDEGFTTLEQRLMTPTNPQIVLQIFRELGTRMNHPATITVGGSLTLMLNQLMTRHTDDIDIVNELPSDLHNNHAMLDELATRYGLRLTHFQSHYLPDQWESRTTSLGVFSHLSVRLVDSIDILVGKLFSNRVKDLDDVRHIYPAIDPSQFILRLKQSTGSFRSDPKLTDTATKNWYILTGQESLPT